MSNELIKPCPFCGGPGVLLNSMGFQYVGAVHDKSCKMKPDTWLFASKSLKKQLKAWNKRHETKTAVMNRPQLY